MKQSGMDPRNYLWGRNGWNAGGPFIPIIISAGIFGVSLVIFSIILIKNYNTDLDGHIRLLKLHLNIGKIPVPPLYYSTLYLLKQIFLTNYKVNTVLLLSLSVLWKFSLALSYVRDHKAFPKPEWMVILVLAGLMFFFPVYLPGIDGSKLYLGKFTPTVWHNSTAIFAFPFSLLLFFRSIRYIELPNQRNFILLFLFGFLILISKPSFLFAIVPVVPLIYILRRKRLDAPFFNLMIFCFLLVGAIGLMAWWIYEKGQIDVLLYGGEKAAIFFAPFEVWLNWTDTPFLDFISSFLFMILFVCFNYKVLFRDWHFGYALMILVAGLTIFWMLAESGERFAHGNFYWQIPICLFIVYLVMIKNWIQMVDMRASLAKTIKGLSKSNMFLLGVFSLHIISGGIYLFKLLYFGSFS